MAAAEPAFARVRPDCPALLVWRVDAAAQLRLVPESQHGTFHRAAAYLVYSAAEQIISGGGRAVRGPLAVHIHFWLGARAAAAAAEAAAAAATRLDRLLGGYPVQHREMERYESPRFRSYFRAGLRYLQGSGDDDDDYGRDANGDASGGGGGGGARMFLVRGNRRPVISQTAAVAWQHLNDGDAFVVDAPRFVFVWCGRAANGLEKIQAARLAQALRQDGRRGREVVIVSSGEEDRLPAAERAAFDALLPLSRRAVSAAPEEARAGPDQRRPAAELALLVCSEDGGEVTLQPVKTGGLTQGDLVPDDVFLVDAGHVVWLWVGRRAQREQRADGLRFAEAYAARARRAPPVPLCRVVDGGEPAEFRSLFGGGWTEAGDGDGDLPPGRAAAPAAAAHRPVAARYDAAMLLHNSELAVQSGLLDDGSGQRSVWRTSAASSSTANAADAAAAADDDDDDDGGGQLELVDERRHGLFCADRCYVVEYCYRVGGRDRFVVFCWLGAGSGQRQRQRAAERADELDGKLRGRAVQARVMQGHEPPQFLAVFGGRVVVFCDERGAAGDRPALLRVSTAGRHAVRALEVPCRADSLDSNDTFVLRSPDCGVLVWRGGGAAAEEREAARALAFELRSSAEPAVVDEGAEPEHFWAALGGRGEHRRAPRPPPRAVRVAPRLFHCADTAGGLAVEEVAAFDQSDLCEDDVTLLDAWEAVFVWVPVRAGRAWRRRAERAALEYLRRDPAGRGADTPVYRVHQQAEPPIFTGLFARWDSDFWATQPSWAPVRRTVAAPPPTGTA